MKRHPALRPLSRDHHRFLMHSQAIRWALDGSRHARPLDQVRAAFLDDWRAAGLAHLDLEEQTLLPLLAGRADFAAPFHADHAWLREQVAALEQRLAEGDDATALLRDLGQRLHDHIRWEERHLFPWLEATLSEAMLAELACRLREREAAG